MVRLDLLRVLGVKDLRPVLEDLYPPVGQVQQAAEHSGDLGRSLARDGIGSRLYEANVKVGY